MDDDDDGAYDLDEYYPAEWVDDYADDYDAWDEDYLEGLELDYSDDLEDDEDFL